VLFARPLTDAERPVRLVWLDTVDVKVDDVDTRTWYVAAPVAVPQLRVGEVDWFVALFVGDIRDGVPGIAIVVKSHTFDQPPVPPAFVALTFQ
jgi:hypothetical protein